MRARIYRLCGRGARRFDSPTNGTHARIMTAIRYTPALRRRAAVIARLGAVGLIALLRARVIGSTRQVGVHANLSFPPCSYWLELKIKEKITRSWKPWLIHARA